MRALTFRGFLEKYVISLSEHHTCSIYINIREIVSGNHRLKEPLYLYASASGKIKTLLAASRGTSVCQEYLALCHRFSYEQFVNILQNKSGEIPEEYHKVWRSYQSELELRKRNKRVKHLMRVKVVGIQKEKHICWGKYVREVLICYPNRT